MKALCQQVSQAVRIQSVQVSGKHHNATVDVVWDDGLSSEERESTILATIDQIISSSSPGIIKIIDLPEPGFEDERNHINNINTKVLRRLFTSVFYHPVRGADTTFNVWSHDLDATRKVGLPNYDTTQVPPPHVDYAFYDHPIQVMGFYGLEGTSLNTWTSPLAALETLKHEIPRILSAPV